MTAHLSQPPCTMYCTCSVYMYSHSAPKSWPIWRHKLSYPSCGTQSSSTERSAHFQSPEKSSHLWSRRQHMFSYIAFLGVSFFSVRVWSSIRRITSICQHWNQWIPAHLSNLNNSLLLHLIWISRREITVCRKFPERNNCLMHPFDVGAPPPTFYISLLSRRGWGNRWPFNTSRRSSFHVSKHIVRGLAMLFRTLHTVCISTYMCVSTCVPNTRVQMHVYCILNIL